MRRRFSDFLGLYEKLSVKQSHQGCIIPPPPEKSVVGGCWVLTSLICFCAVYVNSVVLSGMTKMKVGLDDPSSVEFMERRRAALER